ncbi:MULTISPECIES: hypothetical protein [unclassified Pseudomonas]|uniref:hypothetical protein n=1 Tax=unclassified Pseudomonas TaxID=196821 RepID=UPI00117BA93B|nr:MULTISPECIES: hypothetical protein [unclassified Pseudomonas]MBO9551920.1 hypothetical protein [Pseudomonas sp.]
MLRNGAGAMACDGWAAGVVVVCSGRMLVQNSLVKLDQHKTVLDGGRRPHSLDHWPGLAWAYA